MQQPVVAGHHCKFLFRQVREQRVSNMLQSLLVAACLGITPAIQQIPTGVLWGYFVFMAVESLAGSQLWERLLLLATDPKKRLVIMQQEHAAYMQVRWKLACVQGLLVEVGCAVCRHSCMQPDHAAYMQAGSSIKAALPGYGMSL
jgi:hypothetical protein